MPPPPFVAWPEALRNQVVRIHFGVARPVHSTIVRLADFLSFKEGVYLLQRGMEPLLVTYHQETLFRAAISASALHSFIFRARGFSERTCLPREIAARAI